MTTQTEALKRFLIGTSVENAEGSQIWYVDAATEKEALRIFNEGGADIYASEVEVTATGTPYIDGLTTLDDFGDFNDKPLAQPEQEPVAWEPIETAPKDVMVLVCLPRQMNLVVRAWYNSIHNFWQTDYEGEGGITRPIYFHEGDLWHPIPPLYTTPPQRKPLTDEQIFEIKHNWITTPFANHLDFARAIEAAHGIKGDA